jgi:DNA modification methylase
MNTLITYEGDNLAIMRGLLSETIDLIYIDPPYFSQRDYGDFDDRWKSMQHYFDFMIERLKEMHRLLKPTGSIYVHLDWHAVHYVKVEMDKIFGYDNFVNEIIWHHDMGGRGKTRFARKHDTILFYSKSEKYTFNPVPHSLQE